MAHVESTGSQGAWFVVRNFAGAGLLALGFGVAMAAVCAAIGLLLWGLLKAVEWVAGLLF